MIASSTSPYAFELIETSKAFAALQPRWELLLHTLGHSSLFSRWDWNFSWWESFGKKDDRLAIVWAEHGGNPFGLAPLFVRRCQYYGLPRRLLKFLGEGNSDRSDILAKEHDPQFYTELFRFLFERVGWDLIFLREIPEESGLLGSFKSFGLPAYVERDSECPFIPFSVGMTLESFRKSLSRKTRAEFRNVSNRLKRLGESSVTHRILTTPDDPVLGRVREIESSSRKALREICLVFSPRTNFDFQRRLIERFGGSVQPLLSTLELNDEIIAYLYGFISDGIYYAYNMAFLPTYTRVSPGKVIMQETIEYCILAGLREFDFLRGNSYIKGKWTDCYRKQHHLTVFQKNLLHRLHGWLIFNVRPQVKPLLTRFSRRVVSGDEE